MEAERRARFDELGIGNMRRYALEWQGPLAVDAREWIAEFEKAEREKDAAHKAEELSLARSARDAARTSNIIATLALVAAVIAIAISIIIAFVK